MCLSIIRLVVLSGLFLAATSHLANAIPVQPSNALPTQLNRAQFAAETANLTTIVEDFSGFSTGVKNNPFIFSNGTYTSTPFGNYTSPPSIDNRSLFCGISSATDQCLLSQDPQFNRVFDALPARTTYWSVDIFYIQPSDIIDVAVYGGSGFLNIKTEGQSYYGFNDPLGIKSIRFNNLDTLSQGLKSRGNYSFDNVTTAYAAPEPKTFFLMVFGLLLMVGFSMSKQATIKQGQ